MRAGVFGGDWSSERESFGAMRTKRCGAEQMLGPAVALMLNSRFAAAVSSQQSAVSSQLPVLRRRGGRGRRGA